MSAILKFDFQKRKTITFFWSTLSKIHKKGPILHVTTTFSLKQGGNKNKQCTHSTPLKIAKFRLSLINDRVYVTILKKFWFLIYKKVSALFQRYQKARKFLFCSNISFTYRKLNLIFILNKAIFLNILRIIILWCHNLLLKNQGRTRSHVQIIQFE